MSTNDVLIPLYKEPQSSKGEAFEIKVNFAMAYGDTQNFSQPIYSGNFSYICAFSKKQVSYESPHLAFDEI